MLASRENLPLLAELLAEQHRLDTPVARFSAAHDADRVTGLAPQLIPLTAPGPNEQYAFEVELDSCTGCKSCVAACHALNGLDEQETWRDVGLLVSSDRRHPFTQTITTACHHCADPACLNGCPVLAYEKDPVTGIVRHLDDQCIGCQYCVLKCPYDAPKYNARLGIVRKCDMCHSRLAAGEAPACAQACPTHAIRIVTVAVTPLRISDSGLRIGHSEIRNPQSEIDFLPAAPDPAYTRPTTRFVTQRSIPAAVVASDHQTLRIQPAHWPLVLMLTLLSTAVGLSIVAAVQRSEMATWLAWGAGALGLGASVFHLGQPTRAWRIFLGWRRSWLSREALVFGAWFAAASAALVFPSAAWPSVGLGLAGLICSTMIYVDTRRRFWRAAETLPRFLGTTAVIALAWLAPAWAAYALLAKLVWESRSYFDFSVSARLQRGPLARAVVARDALGLVAIVALLGGAVPFGLVVLFAGELMERYLFFRAVDAPKMPGMPAP